METAFYLAGKNKALLKLGLSEKLAFNVGNAALTHVLAPAVGGGVAGGAYGALFPAEGKDRVEEAKRQAVRGAGNAIVFNAGARPAAKLVTKAFPNIDYRFEPAAEALGGWMGGALPASIYDTYVSPRLERLVQSVEPTSENS